LISTRKPSFYLLPLYYTFLKQFAVSLKENYMAKHNILYSHIVVLSTLSNNNAKDDITRSEMTS
jgi:hypothetical protein